MTVNDSIALIESRIEEAEKDVIMAKTFAESYIYRDKFLNASEELEFARLDAYLVNQLKSLLTQIKAAE